MEKKLQKDTNNVYTRINPYTLKDEYICDGCLNFVDCDRLYPDQFSSYLCNECLIEEVAR